jgi:hypothetical protein
MLFHALWISKKAIVVSTFHNVWLYCVLLFTDTMQMVYLVGRACYVFFDKFSSCSLVTSATLNMFHQEAVLVRTV